MAYIRRKPTARLQKLVEWVGLQSSDVQTSAPTTVLPTNCMELLIHYGDAFQRHTTSGLQDEPLAAVTGQRTRPLKVSCSGTTGVLFASFYPWALRAFTKVPASELTDESVPVEYLFGRDWAVQLQELVSAATCDDGRIAALEQCLLSQLTGPIDANLAGLLQSSLREPDLAVSDMAAQLGIGTRQLHRRFKEQVGIPPKKFLSVLRFQRTLGVRGAYRDDILAKANYYDQAHFCHDFKRYTGQRAGDVLVRMDLSPLERQFNDTSLFYNTLYLQ